MRVLRRFPLNLPLSQPALACLCLVYLFAGITGHDPWKTDDAIHFGISYTMLGSGNWLLPQLAGEFVAGAAPLYYWIGAGCAKLLGGWMPVHDAVRLASALCGAAFLALLGVAGARLNGSQDRGATAAILIAIGSLGLLLPIHDTQPQIALLAASAAFYAGLAHLPQRPLGAGLEAGLGLGLGFLAAGVDALLFLLPLLVLLPLHAQWRSRRALLGIAALLSVAAPLIALWPALLALHQPTAYSAWWSNLGVHLQDPILAKLPEYLELLGWFTWPALPLAVASLWLLRRRLGDAAVYLPLAGSFVALLALLFFHDPRPLPALPVLVPLILLACAGVGRLRRGAANAFDWFGMMTFTLFAALIWLGGFAIQLGIPGQIANNFARLQPGFNAPGGMMMWLLAGAASLLWLWLVSAAPRSPWRGLTNWAAGVTLVWTLVVALMLPWVDYGKSYRGVAAALKASLPAQHQCIAERRLGAAQRLSLDYFAGIKTQRGKTPACDLLLEQSGGKTAPEPEGWHTLWEGHRPGDRSERLRLYQRDRP